MGDAGLSHVASLLPERHRGPGGAFAVLRAGEVLEQGCWGWADTARRIPFTSATPMLVCSITKQFTCAALLDHVRDPETLAPLLRERLPHLDREMPSVASLCHNQSGLRDYWALAMLCGAPAEGRFGPADWERLVAGTRSLQFSPGTRYSYSNGNFRLLSDMLETHTGTPFADLLRRGILDRAGMPHAVLSPDTSSVAGGTVGYEGSVAEGFRPAVNRITWTGDAGLAASLDDMIAWARFIDRTRDDVDGIHARLAAPVRFLDGTAARYGFGLARMTICGRPVTGHAGGLRGFRSFRLHCAAERISVVVLFNHMADPREAASDLLAAVLDGSEPAGPSASGPGWAGRYVDEQTGLAVRLDGAPDGRIRLLYGTGPDVLDGDGPSLRGPGGVRVSRDGDGLVMERAAENLVTRLVPAGETVADDVEGVFHHRELDATLTVARSGHALSGAFEGFLGGGDMQAMSRFGRDIWTLPCPRALDYAAPGDWTLAFRRDDRGQVSGVRVGCWLARGLEFERR